MTKHIKVNSIRFRTDSFLPLPFGRTETTAAKAGEQICEICKLRHGKSRRNTRPLHTIRP